MPRLNMPTIDKTLRLDQEQYYATTHKKSLIVLHHTVGGSPKSTFKWWESDPRHIATAYIVSRGGIVYELFDPKHWAWHLGVKDRGMEQRSIGIELASWGALTEKTVDGVMCLYALDGKKRLGTVEEMKAKCDYYARGFRGYKWIMKYPKAQIAAVNKLVRNLCEDFGIPMNLPLEAAEDHCDLQKWFDYKGVVHHAMLRDDKSDLHPGFPFDRLGYSLDDPEWKKLRS